MSRLGAKNCSDAQGLIHGRAADVARLERAATCSAPIVLFRMHLRQDVHTGPFLQGFPACVQNPLHCMPTRRRGQAPKIHHDRHQQYETRKAPHM